MSNDERRARAEHVQDVLWDLLKTDPAAEYPEDVLPRLAFMLGFVTGAVVERQGLALTAMYLHANMTSGLEAHEAVAKKRTGKRKRGMNKASAVKAVEDLLKGKQP